MMSNLIILIQQYEPKRSLIHDPPQACPLMVLLYLEFCQVWKYDQLEKATSYISYKCVITLEK